MESEERHGVQTLWFLSITKIRIIRRPIKHVQQGIDFAANLIFPFHLFLKLSQFVSSKNKVRGVSDQKLIIDRSERWKERWMEEAGPLGLSEDEIKWRRQKLKMWRRLSQVFGLLFKQSEIWMAKREMQSSITYTVKPFPFGSRWNQRWYQTKVSS